MYEIMHVYHNQCTHRNHINVKAKKCIIAQNRMFSFFFVTKNAYACNKDWYCCRNESDVRKGLSKSKAKQYAKRVWAKFFYKTKHMHVFNILWLKQSAFLVVEYKISILLIKLKWYTVL